MKLVAILVLVACSNAAKLDRTYLPPSHASTSGGSSFLQAPFSGSNQQTFAAQRSPVNNFGNFARIENLENNYSSSGAFAASSNGFGSNNAFSQNAAQASFESRPERAQAAFERNAGILRQDTQNDGETYAYSFETENGITAEEQGVATNGVEAQGGYSYTGDDGQVYSVRYTADQNGFVPQGDHLPTPPPIPAEILAALEQNARDEANGIFDDGSYNEAKYSSGDNGQYNGNIQHENTFNGNYNGNIQHGSGNIQHGSGNIQHGSGNIQHGNGNVHHEAIQQDDEDTIVTNNALFRSQANPSGNFGAKSEQYRSQSQNFAQNNGFQSQVATKAYLPPVANQRAQENTFARRQQSFNSRTGYQY